jgi:hypothetical protein
MAGLSLTLLGPTTTPRSDLLGIVARPGGMDRGLFDGGRWPSPPSLEVVASLGFGANGAVEVPTGDGGVVVLLASAGSGPFKSADCRWRGKEGAITGENRVEFNHGG